jgi:hypothetical protein
MEPMMARRACHAIASTSNGHLHGLERCVIGGREPTIGRQG